MDNMTVAHILKRRRLELQASQVFLAKSAHVCPNTVVHCENGTHIPAIPQLLRMVEALRLEIHFVCIDTGERIQDA